MNLRLVQVMSTVLIARLLHVTCYIKPTEQLVSPVTKICLTFIIMYKDYIVKTNDLHLFTST